MAATMPMTSASAGALGSASTAQPHSARRGRSPPWGEGTAQPPSSPGWEEDRLASHAQQRDAFISGTIARFDPRYGAPYEARFDPRATTERRHGGLNADPNAASAAARRAARPWQMQSAFSRLQLANADVDRAERDCAVLREKVESLYAKIDGSP